MQTRDAQPLQPLSPERVNASIRPPTSMEKSFKASELSLEAQKSSSDSSPMRKAKVSLFAEYDPQRKPAASTSFTAQQCPSLPDMNIFQRTSHVRTNSDVQGLVKRFEHLDVRDRDAESADRRKKLEAELSRAKLAREEAESDARRLKEEVRHWRTLEQQTRQRVVNLAKEVERLRVGGDQRPPRLIVVVMELTDTTYSQMRVRLRTVVLLKWRCIEKK